MKYPTSYINDSSCFTYEIINRKNNFLTFYIKFVDYEHVAKNVHIRLF